MLRLLATSQVASNRRVAACTAHLEMAHDGLLASGELSLIRDERLRNRLAAWPSYVAEWSEEEDFVFSFAKESLTPFLSERIRLRSVHRAFPPLIDGQPLPSIPVSSVDTASLLSLKTSAKFDNLVYQRAQGLWHALNDGETLRAQLSEILELIQQNLDE